MSRCRWVYDKDVPDGRFLVPGCMNRAEALIKAGVIPAPQKEDK